MATEQSKTLLKYEPRISDEKQSGVGNDLYSRLSSSTTLEAVSSILRDASQSSLQTDLHASQEQRSYEYDQLLSAVLVKSGLATLSIILDRVLNEALQAEQELDWWRRLESSVWNTAYYTLQTFPIRIVRLARDITADARRNQALFRFNHETFCVHIAPYLQAFRSSFPIFSRHQSSTRLVPHELVRQECTAHRKGLEVIRDTRARQVGELSFLGTTIITALEDLDGSEFPVSNPQAQYTALVHHLASSIERILEDHEWSPSLEHMEQVVSAPTASTSLQNVLRTTLPSHSIKHQTLFIAHQRPGLWTRSWPRLVLFPPLILLGMRSAYQNRSSIYATIIDAGRTVRSFCTERVLEPIRDILSTVRTGGNEGAARIISRDGLKSDMDSLERMVIDLATETQAWSDAELRDLSEQIRRGDLAPVLRVYESDIKRPVRSALGGTLIRSLLIQVQKAKVDIDFALTGIDKLLRSQELTFGFVGVAPSLAVLYAVGGWLRSLLWKRDSHSSKKYGGTAKRRASFYAMRRVESILTKAAAASPLTAHASLRAALQSRTIASLPMDAQTHGLLVVSLTYLRRFAEANLRRGSQQREAFIGDLADLEDSKLSKEDKLRVVERVWRSWGMVLGWGSPRFA